MSNKTASKVCQYVSPSGLTCQRKTHGKFCVFHIGCDRKLNEGPVNNPQFEPAFDLLLEQKDGNWDGFVFPSCVKFPKLIEFPIFLRSAQFLDFNLSNTTFQDAVDFSDSNFLGKMRFHGITFKSHVKFDRCRFEDCLELQYTQFEQSASFYQAELSNRSVFRASFHTMPNFNGTIFRESVDFSGWTESQASLHASFSFGSPKLTTWQYIKKSAGDAQEKLYGWRNQIVRRFATREKNIKIFRVFEEEGQLHDVIFVKPDQVKFSQVNLSGVYFRGTNLRGARFLGVNWWQPKLGRNGLKDELFIRLSDDGPFRFQNLPALEQTCRNVRVAYEESRDFNIASDFYIAEMEALRAQFSFLRRNIFSVAACYHFVSYYGTSVTKAILVLISLFVLHLELTIFCFNRPETYDQLVGYIINGLPNDALHTFKIMTLQMVSSIDQDSLPIGKRWLDAFFRILAPTQIAMLILAFRARIKRS